MRPAESKHDFCCDNLTYLHGLGDFPRYVQPTTDRRSTTTFGRMLKQTGRGENSDAVRWWWCSLEIVDGQVTIAVGLLGLRRMESLA